MSAFLDPAWLESWCRRVNADREMAVIGEFFTTAFSAATERRRAILRVEHGRIVETWPKPRFDVRCVFGLRAPAATWDKFLSPKPPPLYHDIFAMIMRVPELVLEGDTLAAMQNARALHRMLSLMRQEA